MKIQAHAVLFAAAALLAMVPHAQAQTTQQQKMKACNAEAKATAKKGDERKTFMKACLGAKPAQTKAAPAVAPAAKPGKP